MELFPSSRTRLKKYTAARAAMSRRIRIEGTGHDIHGAKHEALITPVLEGFRISMEHDGFVDIVFYGMVK
jgi:hypothetical protein